MRTSTCCWLLAWFLLCGVADAEPVAWWSFDEGEGQQVRDRIGDCLDRVAGNAWYADGVSGSCLKLDGYTTRVVRTAQQAPRILDEFTVEAWVAPQTLPWNWTAVINQEKEHRDGFFFGISADGNVGFGAALVTDGQWHMCVSEGRIEPLKWSHIAASIDDETITIYINGKESGQYSAEDYGWERLGSIRPARGSDLLIGMSCTKTYPKGTERAPSRRELSFMVFDGLIDEVMIHNEAMHEDEIQEAYQRIQPENPQPLQWRRFPTEGSEIRRFGAFYTTLKYDDTWDSLWRMDEHSDVVVTFEEPVRVVFWRGINYAASYVSENGIWMGDQSLEGYSAWGCNEHMSDKQCRFANVRIIENHPARIVIHWRYALADIIYQIVNTDPQTKWGDWADEYFVIYPDAVVVRRQSLWSSNYGAPYSASNEMEDTPKHQFQETILFNQPGTWPRDNVNTANALTVATMKGETFDCIWGEDMEYEEEDILHHDIVKNATIQLTNLKSKYKPFIIFETGSRIEPWVGEDHSFWNHWPVAQLPSDGRFAPSNDRPSHTSLSNGVPIVHNNGNKHTAVMLYGLKDGPIEELIPLARSWNHPPELRLLKGDVENLGYDKFQRAYVLKFNNGARNTEIQLAGSRQQPIINPAIVLKGWGDQGVVVKGKNGIVFEEGLHYRKGYERKLQGTDLVLWFDGESERVETRTLEPSDE